MPDRQTPTFLLVGGTAFDQEVERSFLQRRDVRLLFERPGPQVVETARRERPAAILLDIQREDDPCFEVCRGLRTDAAARAIPFVILTNRGIPLADCAAEGDAVVYRPLLQRELLQAFRRFAPVLERENPRCSVNLRFSYSLGGRDAQQTLSRDLSQGGAFLADESPVAVGAEIALRFRLPGEEAEISSRGVVRHAREGSPRPYAGSGFGVQFMGMPADDRDRLAKFVEHQLRRPTFIG